MTKSTADLNHVLLKIAHPDIYERNPFNVLNLPVTATARDIRRRKEDIEAAFDAGNEAEEFSNVLPANESRQMPTRDEVAELFRQLEDPEARIAFALFWFWPEDGAGKRSSNSNPNASFRQTETIAGWEKEATRTEGTSEGLVARHNLAVFHHMMGLAYELALEKYDKKEVETPEYVHTYWKAGIHWWNDIVGNVDFWRLVSEQVSILNDSRVDYRFARSLRDQFAFAFDQINVELAIEFAKVGRTADAKRQVEYMQISQPDADDVEGTFDDAFSGLLRHTEAVTRTAENEAKKHKKNGLKYVRDIWDRTEDILFVAKTLFNPGMPIRAEIVSRIFHSICTCCGWYAVSHPSDLGFQVCLKWLKRVQTIAETPEQQARVDEQIRNVIQIRKLEEDKSQCWLCKQPVDRNDPQLHFGVIVACHPQDMYVDGQKVEMIHRTIQVPVCANCQKNGANPQTLKDIHLYSPIRVLLDKGWFFEDQSISENPKGKTADISCHQSTPKTNSEEEAKVNTIPVWVDVLVAIFIKALPVMLLLGFSYLITNCGGH